MKNNPAEINHHINIIKNEISTEVLKLIKLENENIVGFKGVYFKRGTRNARPHIAIYIARDLVDGVSIETFSKVTNWKIKSIKEMINALLQGLLYLQRNDIYHGNINQSSIFLDNNGMWKIADFDIISRLNHLSQFGRELPDQLAPTQKEDFNCIVKLLESFEINSTGMKNFIDACKEGQSLEDLCEHPFLQSMERTFEDFVVLEILGKGGFAEVFKVMDTKLEMEYALKRIKIDSKGKDTLTPAKREAQRLAKLTAGDNKHITRYYQYWTEEMLESEYNKFSLEKELQEMNLSKHKGKR